MNMPVAETSGALDGFCGIAPSDAGTVMEKAKLCPGGVQSSNRTDARISSPLTFDEAKYV